MGNTYTLKVVEGIYVEKPPEFINHKRAVNFIARIVGIDMSNKLKYEFLKRVYIGNESFYQVKDFIPGEFYVITSKYYTSSGRLSNYNRLFLKCTRVSDNVIEFDIVDLDDVVKGIKQKSSGDDISKAVEELKRIESILLAKKNMLEEEVKHYIAHVENLKYKIREYSEILKQSEKEKVKLEKKLNEVMESSKEAYEKQVESLKKYSVIVAKMFGVKKEFDSYYYEYYRKHEVDDKVVVIHIKTKGDEPYYMKVNSEYLFIDEKNPTPIMLMFGFRVLKKIVEDNLQLIESSKPELPDINVSEVQALKNEYMRLLKDRALKVAKAYGVKKDELYRFTWKTSYGEVEIKAGARSVKYFRVGNKYIISKYSEEPGFFDIIFGLKVLDEVIREWEARLKSNKI